MQIIIDIPKEIYEEIQVKFLNTKVNQITVVDRAIYNGIPVNADTLAHMIINERIYGDFKQDICYEEHVVDDVKCRLELSIIDHRPCYCGAELREVWRESEVSDAGSD